MDDYRPAAAKPNLRHVTDAEALTAFKAWVGGMHGRHPDLVLLDARGVVKLADGPWKPVRQ